MAINTRMYEEVQNNSEALVLAHLGMVKRVALHLKVRLPPFMELDELIQVGMIGLLEASRAYDPAKGIEFENFAHSRVRGAILDEVRRLSFLAEHMGKDIELFHKERSQARRFETYSMEVVSEEVMNMAGDASHQPEAIVEHAQFMRALTGAIADLPERDQLLMNLYYVEELNLKEIGEVRGVTESRVSQLLTAVVKKLRGTLNVTPVETTKSRSNKA